MQWANWPFYGGMLLVIGGYATVLEAALLKAMHIPLADGFQWFFFDILMGYPDFYYHSRRFHLPSMWSPSMTLYQMHAVMGCLLFIMVPFQFSQSFRQASINRHRWMGRVAMFGSFCAAVGLVSMLVTPGLIFGCSPITDDFPSLQRVVPETVSLSECPNKHAWFMVCTFLPHFVLSGVMSMRAIFKAKGKVGEERAELVLQHKVWMMRHVANACSAGVFRIVLAAGVGFFYAKTLSTAERRAFFGRLMGFCWTTSLLATEYYIRTRVYNKKTTALRWWIVDTKTSSSKAGSSILAASSLSLSGTASIRERVLRTEVAFPLPASG